jgi:hypothetical protein
MQRLGSGGILERSLPWLQQRNMSAQCSFSRKADLTLM